MSQVSGLPPQMPPLVSVIIPSYNYGRFVREAVDSALAQSYRPLEVIVVDDGSKDNTREVMQAYAGNPDVKYIQQANKGLPSARNTGIRAATGKYIALLDADDVWAPEKLSQQVAFYEQHPDAAVVATDTEKFEGAAPRAANWSQPPPPNSTVRGGHHFESGVSYTEYTIPTLLEYLSFRPSSVMMRKDLCLAAGMFDEEMKYVEDLDMWIRIGTLGQVVRLNTVLTGARGHPAVQSQHAGPNLEYHRRVLDKLFATIPEFLAHPHWRRAAEARMYVHVSWMKYCAGNRWGGIRDIVTSMLRWPPALPDHDGSKAKWKRAKTLARYLLRRYDGT